MRKQTMKHWPNEGVGSSNDTANSPCIAIASILAILPSVLVLTCIVTSWHVLQKCAVRAVSSFEFLSRVSTELRLRNNHDLLLILVLVTNFTVGIVETFAVSRSNLFSRCISVKSTLINQTFFSSNWLFSKAPTYCPRLYVIFLNVLRDQVVFAWIVSKPPAFVSSALLYFTFTCVFPTTSFPRFILVRRCFVLVIPSLLLIS